MILRSLSAALAAGVVVTCAGLSAQGPLAQTTTGTITTEPLPLPEEQEVAVREYIGRRPVNRIVAIPGDAVRPGGIVPRNIRLSPLADLSVAGLNRYAYIVSPDKKIVIVDPATRQVMHVIDR